MESELLMSLWVGSVAGLSGFVISGSVINNSLCVNGMNLVKDMTCFMIPSS